MEKIYYEDQNIKSFRANIIEIKNIDGKYHIRLDKTAFFPGGGGQFGDVGTIGTEEVKEVYEENGYIYHIVEKTPICSENIECCIDVDRRKDGMHQHLGQHIISGCFFKMFNANTISFHLGKEVSTVDIVGSLTEEQIRTVEKLANKAIEENLKVYSFVPEKDKLDELGLRRALPNTEEDIRIVKIGELDINACCGVHPKSTIEVRLIKIKKWEKNKGATRIEFLAGKRAVDDAINTERYLSDICKYLSTSEIEVINRLKNLDREIKDITEKNRKINYEMAIKEAKNLLETSEKINGLQIIKKLYVDVDKGYISKVIKEIVESENTVALFGNKNDQNINITYAASKDYNLIGMNELIKESLELIKGKGGGSEKLAQGFGKNVDSINILKIAAEKLKKSINSRISNL